MNEVVPKRVYFTVWIVIVVLSVVNAALAFVRLGPFNSAVTMLIAVFNAFLIVWYVIGVRRYPPLMKVIVAIGFVWMGLMIHLTMADYLTRAWSTTTTRSVTIPAGKAPFEEPALGSATRVPTAAVPPYEPTALPQLPGMPGGQIGVPTIVPTGQIAAPPARGRTVRIELSASNASFDKDRIVVPTGSTVIVRFTNDDPVFHNFSVYRDAAGQRAIFVGQAIRGPGAMIVYRFRAPSKPGVYLFRCDIHPVAMRGSFVVK